MTLAEAGVYVGRHPKTLAKEVRRGRLRAARIGGKGRGGEYRFLAEWLDELAQVGQVAVSDQRLRSAINEHILPAVSGGRVSMVNPSTRVG